MKREQQRELRSRENNNTTMGKTCGLCSERAILKRPKTGDMLCKKCFFEVFEREVHETIVNNKLFKKGDRVAIAASGGKGKPSKQQQQQQL